MALVEQGFLLNTPAPQTVVANRFHVEGTMVSLLAYGLTDGDFITIQQRIPPYKGQPERWVNCVDKGAPIQLLATRPRLNFFIEGEYRLGQVAVAGVDVVVYFTEQRISRGVQWRVYAEGDLR